MLDTCLSPVARVFLPRRGNDTSLPEAAARFLLSPRLASRISREPSFVLVAHVLRSRRSASVSRELQPRDSPPSKFIPRRHKTDGRNRPI